MSIQCNPFRHYRYDALDRLVASALYGEAECQRFYCKRLLTTEVEGEEHCSIFHNDGQVLAQKQGRGDALFISLLTTDQNRTVLQTSSGKNTTHHILYTPYGYTQPESWQTSLLGFNGERPDSLTGHYLLGNGYRAFNPVLMRFNSPDSFSPFGSGGLNPYAYCLGNPITRRDPTGRTPILMDSIVNALVKHKPRLKIPRPHLIPSTTSSLNGASSTADGYLLAAFHGSSSKHLQSFEKGLDINLAGSANGQKHGEGFYATLDIDFAGNYAKTSVDRDYRGNKQDIFPYADFSYDPAIANTSYIAGKSPTIYGVYVKDYPSKQPGRDFTFIPGDRGTAVGSELVFPAAMYQNIRLLPIPSLANLPTPWLGNINIRKS